MNSFGPALQPRCYWDPQHSHVHTVQTRSYVHTTNHIYTTKMRSYHKVAFTQRRHVHTVWTRSYVQTLHHKPHSHQSCVHTAVPSSHCRATFTSGTGWAHVACAEPVSMDKLMVGEGAGVSLSQWQVSTLPMPPSQPRNRGQNVLHPGASQMVLCPYTCQWVLHTRTVGTIFLVSLIGAASQHKSMVLHPCTSQQVLHPCTSQWVMHPCTSQWVLHPCTSQQVLHPCTSQWVMHPCTSQWVLHPCTRQWHLYPCTSQWVMYSCTSQWVIHPCTSQWVLQPGQATRHYEYCVRVQISGCCIPVPAGVACLYLSMDIVSLHDSTDTANIPARITASHPAPHPV